MNKYMICKKDEIKAGEKRLVSVNNKDIVLVRTLENKYYAVSNNCPHEGAKMCNGMVGGTFMSENIGNYDYVKNGEIIRCPWHGYEFDMATGCSLFDPEKYKIKKYDLVDDDHNVIISL